MTMTLALMLGGGVRCAGRSQVQEPSAESVAWGVSADQYVAAPPAANASAARPSPHSNPNAGSGDSSPPQASPASQPAAETSPSPLPNAYVDAASKLHKYVEEHPKYAWERLAYMCDTFGHRFSGSKSLEQAIDWTVETLKKDGFAEARREKVMVPRWVRGREQARVVAPVKRDLVLLGLGMSVGTGSRGIKAEVVAVHSLDEITARAQELKGKIVLINQKMPPYDREHHETGYGATVQIRRDGPSFAAKHGAKALLIRSVTAHSLRTPHTGSLRYAEDAPKIPAAALSPADADFVERMVNRGPVKLELTMGAKTLRDSASANVLAELRGREKPEEIVVIGGHIDSWDVGQGANDDGSGILMAMDALRMLKELGLVPRRTIRAVLFTNEENGMRGAKAYFEAHQKELHVAAMEADFGSGRPEAIGIGGSETQVAELQRFVPLFAPLGIQELRSGGGGADISPLMKAGVLGLSIEPDGSHYFDVHHTWADTVEKIDPLDLQRNAAAMALMAYILAERKLGGSGGT